MDWLLGFFDEIKFGSRRSSKWRSVRKAYIKLHPLCAVCKTKKRLEIHHCKPFHLSPTLELSKKNLITLCKRHHLTFGHLMNYHAYNPNIREDAKNFRLKIKNRLYE